MAKIRKPGPKKKERTTAGPPRSEYGLRRVPGDTSFTSLELRAFQGGNSAGEQWLNALIDRLEVDPNLPEYRDCRSIPAVP